MNALNVKTKPILQNRLTLVSLIVVLPMFQIILLLCVNHVQFIVFSVSQALFVLNANLLTPCLNLSAFSSVLTRSLLLNLFLLYVQSARLTAKPVSLMKIVSLVNLPTLSSKALAQLRLNVLRTFTTTQSLPVVQNVPRNVQSAKLPLISALFAHSLTSSILLLLLLAYLALKATFSKPMNASLFVEMVL